MGKREIKFSLGTADPVLAKIRFQEENAKLERVWHEHLHGQEYAKLSQRQLSALAGQFYQEMIAAHSDNPGRAFDWQLMVKRDQERIAKRFPLKGRVYHMRETFGGEARAFLEKKGYRLSGETLDMFIEELVRTKLEAAEQLVRNASFNYADDPHAGRFAPPEVLKSDGKVAAIDMFEKYANEAQLDGKTRESWETKIKSLIAFVGHDDLARLTSEEVIAWDRGDAKTGAFRCAGRLRAVFAHGPKPACDHHHAPDAAASTATRPNVRDDGQRPSTGTGWREF
jgi:hypothetical protein